MLNSFVKKPVLETDLKTQMNLALGKESRKEAIHEDNCTGVTIVLGEDGSIQSTSHNIKKITGKSSAFYKQKNIASASFDIKLQQLLTKILKKVRTSTQKSFVSIIMSPYLGERLIEITVNANTANSYELKFRDLTNISVEKQHNSY